MGNEQSQIPGIQINQRALEVLNFYSQHSGSVVSSENLSKLSIFIGNQFISEALWSPSTPLEKYSKNLMIYRHPSIIKYISSWQKAGKFYLAVEEVIPLSHIISNMATMEVCLGLYSVLTALCFLHNKAFVSHNNVGLASIYVSKEGNWKLGGMEFLCSYKDLTTGYLNKSRKDRYSKGIDSNEEKNLATSNGKKDFIDLYAFCSLSYDLLKQKSDGDVSSVTTFKDFCKDIIQNPDFTQRPTLLSLMDHPFFNHKFINIYSYLIELPLKSDIDKAEFFSTLKKELSSLEEETVASQMGGLLLSRMVLLNNVAQNSLLPGVLKPRKDGSEGIFSEDVFKKFITPKLLRIFSVRDVQIRLLLIKYFPHFINCFSTHELQTHILPELLVGIKDTNDDLVVATLHTLADLIPVLGSEIVIGRKRAKLFNDGQPKIRSSFGKASGVLKKEDTQSQGTSLNIENLSLSSSVLELIQNELPERPRPDGEEEETSTEVEQSADEDNDNWEDWENDNHERRTSKSEDCSSDDSRGTYKNKIPSEISTVEIESLDNAHILSSKKLNKIPDINELDIKNQTRLQMEETSIDFFQDMEPVIETNTKFLVSERTDTELVSNKLSVIVNEEMDEDGWGDEW